MTFDRSRLPDPSQFYESEGLKLTGPKSSKWRTTQCHFHRGSDSMRVNISNGAFKCMSCQVGGGDVLSYYMQLYGDDFVQAAKKLGAWIDDGHYPIDQTPKSLPATRALEVLAFEATLVAVAAGNVANGIQLTDTDKDRLIKCVGRISRIRQEYLS